MVDPDNNSYLHVIKYKDVDDIDTKTKISKGYRYIMPVLRCPKCILSRPSVARTRRGTSYLNAVRTARNVKNIQDDADLTASIEQEYKGVRWRTVILVYKRKWKPRLCSYSGEKQGTL